MVLPNRSVTVDVELIFKPKVHSLWRSSGLYFIPILFSIFINDIFNCCKSSLIQLYADDTQIYLSHPIGLVEDLGDPVNEDLVKICEWSKINKLLINTTKTLAIWFHHAITMNTVRLAILRLHNASIYYVIIIILARTPEIGQGPGRILSY